MTKVSDSGHAHQSILVPVERPHVNIVFM